MNAFGYRRLRNHSVSVSIGRNELALAAVPFGEDLCGRRASQDSGMDQAGKPDVGDMAGGAEDALKIPDRLRTATYSASPRLSREKHRHYSRLGIDLIQQPPSILAMEDAAESPRLVLERLHILDLDQQNVARFGGVDVKRAGKIVDLGEVDVFDVVRGIVVLDLAAGPVETFDLDDFAVGDLSAGRDCSG